MAERQKPSWEEKFDERMQHFEKKIDALGKKIEDKGKWYGKELEGKAKGIQGKMRRKMNEKYQFFWGAVLIVVGLVWLANNLGWFRYSIPLIPVAMIVFGIYLILKYHEIPEKDKKDRKK